VSLVVSTIIVVFAGPTNLSRTRERNVLQDKARSPGARGASPPPVPLNLPGAS
jgi:hypothetical protein